MFICDAIAAAEVDLLLMRSAHLEGMFFPHGKKS
jgi:hypothetical protein